MSVATPVPGADRRRAHTRRATRDAAASRRCTRARRELLQGGDHRRPGRARPAAAGARIFVGSLKTVPPRSPPVSALRAWTGASTVPAMFEKRMLATWGDMDYNAHMRNT